jgi:hypothetical protein
MKKTCAGGLIGRVSGDALKLFVDYAVVAPACQVKTSLHYYFTKDVRVSFIHKT